jgi:hypothetical protein
MKYIGKGEGVEQHSFCVESEIHAKTKLGEWAEGTDFTAIRYMF